MGEGGLEANNYIRTERENWEEWVHSEHVRRGTKQLSFRTLLSLSSFKSHIIGAPEKCLPCHHALARRSGSPVIDDVSMTTRSDRVCFCRRPSQFWSRPPTPSCAKTPLYGPSYSTLATSCAKGWPLRPSSRARTCHRTYRCNGLF